MYDTPLGYVKRCILTIVSLAGPAREIIVEPVTVPASAPKPQSAPQPA